METRASYITVGFFVLLFTVASVFFTLWINRTDWDVGTLYDIYFEGSITGLRENETVTYNGVPIGSVIKIDIDPEKVHLIRVLVEIDSPKLIRKNTVASLESKGITGQVQVKMLGSTPDSPLLEPEEGERYPVIPSIPSKFQQVFDEVPKVVQKFSVLLDSMIPMFNSKNRENLSDMLESASAFSQSLAQQKDTFSSSLQHMESSFQNFNTAMEKISQGGVAFERSMEQLEATIKENRPHLKHFTANSLPKVGDFVTDVRQLANSLRLLAENLERHPMRYVFEPSNSGVIVE
ncbi:MAG: MlaD family protein [Alphaproteobacteria bacterium]